MKNSMDVHVLYIFDFSTTSRIGDIAVDTLLCICTWAEFSLIGQVVLHEVQRAAATGLQKKLSGLEEEEEEEKHSLVMSKSIYNHFHIHMTQPKNTLKVRKSGLGLLYLFGVPNFIFKVLGNDYSPRCM